MCCPSALHLHTMAGRAIKFGNRRRKREGAQQWRSHHRINVYSCVCVCLSVLSFFARQERRNDHHLIFYHLFFSDSALFQVSHGVDSIHTHTGNTKCFFLKHLCRVVHLLPRLPSYFFIILFCFFFRGNTSPNTPLFYTYHWKQFRFSRFFIVISSPIELLLLCFLFRSSAPDVRVWVSLFLLSFGNRRE